MSKLDAIIDMVEDGELEIIAGLCYGRLLAGAEILLSMEMEMMERKDEMATMRTDDALVLRSNAVNDLILYWAKRVVEQKRNLGIFIDVIHHFMECTTEAKIRGIEASEKDAGALLKEATAFEGFLLGVEEMVYMMMGGGRVMPVVGEDGKVRMEPEVLDEEDEDRLYEVFRKDEVLRELFWGDGD